MLNKKANLRRTADLHVVLFSCLLAAASASANDRVFDVREYGAKSGGETLCTQAIQQAIDQCAGKGGGTVYLPPGKWLSGTIYMESGVTLFFEAGCTLVGSRNPEHYGQPRMPLGGGEDSAGYSLHSLIAGENLHHVALRGQGQLDGSGSAFRWKGAGRPKGVYLRNCSDVFVENITMRSAGSWMQHYRDCDRVAIRGVTVFNHVTYNNDGLNIDSCRNVRISDCVIDSDDDALVLKSLSDRPCENVVITNCVISSHCNAIKMGTESGGGFQNVTVANCVIQSPQESQSIYGRQRGLAGIALEIVDGGCLERIAIANIVMKGVSVPIFMRLGNRARQYVEDGPKPGVGTFRNVVVSNIIADNTSEIGCSITGLPGHPIENVSLSNIKLGFDGGEAKELSSQEVPEKTESYPESTMFGTLPAYGFYCRHVDGLQFDNVQLRTTEPDLRHAIACEDVANLVIDGLDAGWWKDASAMIRLTQVRGALISGCRPSAPEGAFLRLEGDATRDVVLSGNDLSSVGAVVEAAPGVPKNALSQLANRVTD